MTAAVRISVPRQPVAHTIARDVRAQWPVRDEVIVLNDVQLESGDVVDELSVHFRLEGAIDSTRNNVVLVAHALTGDAHASNWWRGVIGQGEALDPAQHAILCANVLGGCAGTVARDRSGAKVAPVVTTRDQATVLARLLDALDVDTPCLVIGGSLGGMIALEFAATYPARVRQAVVLAAPAVQTAQGIAWNTLMRHALALGGARDGLALARMIAMLSYRTPHGLESRFGRTTDASGVHQVTRWLEVHGHKLVSRFDAASYTTLLHAMDTHDVGRGRGGVFTALEPVRHKVTAVGIRGDLLYPSDVVKEWALVAGCQYEEIQSPHGHDAFLLETRQVANVVRRVLGTPVDSKAVGASYVVTARKPKPARVAIAGCGNVGGGLLELLTQSAVVADRPIEVVRVLARDGSRARPSLVAAAERQVSKMSTCITDASSFVDNDIDLLVEVIGGTGTASMLIQQALQRGIPVVTANKTLLAQQGAYLSFLAKKHGTTLNFEAAAGGAIPVVRSLRAQAAGVGVTHIRGILNGTSNYVLDQVTSGASLADAVACAQANGYAEADPTRDLDGSDVADKLRVLSWLAFGVDPADVRVDQHGITAETAEFARCVAEEGDRVKLLASCWKDGSRVRASVAPVRVPLSDAFARVDGARNRIVVESASAGALVFEGAGAGGRATAGAVLSDVLEVISR